jgi:hypothetical protein
MKMDCLVPTHQFEVRFSEIINFSSRARDVLAPFIKLASKIAIENENSVNERITLHFEQNNTTIGILWDRVILHHEPTTDSKTYWSLSENNSIFEEPFLNILNKLLEINNGGQIKNYLMYSVFVKPEDKDLTVIKKEISEKFFTPAVNSLLPGYDDFAFTLEKHSEDTEFFYTYGPYVGIQDLNNRNVKIKGFELIKALDCKGIMLEYKEFELIKTIDFKKVQKCYNRQKSFIESLWK